MKKVTTGMANRKNIKTGSHGIRALEKVSNKTSNMPQITKNTVTMVKKAAMKSFTDHLGSDSVM